MRHYLAVSLHSEPSGGVTRTYADRYSKGSIGEVTLLPPGWASVKRRRFGAAMRRQIQIEFTSGSITVAVRDIDSLTAAVTDYRSEL